MTDDAKGPTNRGLPSSLHVEATEVFIETGLTPREMMAERDRLREAAKDLLDEDGVMSQHIKYKFESALSPEKNGPKP